MRASIALVRHFELAATTEYHRAPRGQRQAATAKATVDINQFCNLGGKQAAAMSTCMMMAMGMDGGCWTWTRVQARVPIGTHC